MGLPASKVSQGNGNIGVSAASADGVAALVFTGVAPAGAEFALGDHLTVFSLKEAEALGIDADYDTTNSVQVYEHIKDFYAEAGTGAELHFMVIAQTNSMAQIMDKANAYAKKLLEDEGGRIKLLGCVRNPDVGYAAVYETGFDDDVWAAIAKAKELRDDEFSKSRYCRFFIEGRDYQGVHADALDLRSEADGPNANAVSVVIHQNPDVAALGGFAAASAGVGLALGRAAAIAVNRNIGRVKDGPVSWDKAGLSSGDALDSFTEAAFDVLHDKGYIFLRKHLGKSGFYFNDDHAACPLDDDYAFLRNGRAMDKATQIVQELYVDDLLDDFELDPNTGRMNPAVIKAFQDKANEAILDGMLRNGKNEISGSSVFVDPDQDVQTTQEIKTKISLVQRGIAKVITSELAYKLSLNS